MTRRRGPVRTRRSLPLLLVLVVAGCSGPLLANPPAPRPLPPATPTPGPTLPDPQPINFPRDDGPHHRLTEWWYVTGHLRTASGGHDGFEFVVFRGERGQLPVAWASHVALTDEDAGRFTYAQRSVLGPQVDRSPRGSDGAPLGFDFVLPGSTGSPSSPGTAAWEMAGAGDDLRLAVALAPQEAEGAALPGGLAWSLALHAEKPPVLHRGGWIDFGPAGGSYYYSRTRLAVGGTLDLGAGPAPVTGLAWFDHQWGDFIAIGGGWDWFAISLDDGSDLTLSLVRDPEGATALAYGTLVDANGTATTLDATAFRVTTTGSWTSPHSGARYPAGWIIDVPSRDLRVTLIPTVADQELDARATTGVVYWEGSQRVTAVRHGQPLGGQAYVELTGYAGR
jgi:predicted secreted hydrolase